MENLKKNLKCLAYQTILGFNVVFSDLRALHVNLSVHFVTILIILKNKNCKFESSSTEQLQIFTDAECCRI